MSEPLLQTAELHARALARIALLRGDLESAFTPEELREEDLDATANIMAAVPAMFNALEALIRARAFGWGDPRAEQVKCDAALMALTEVSDGSK